MEIQIESVKGHVCESKPDLKDLSKKVDTKADKIDSIDRLLYFFIRGILFKGGVDFT